MGTGKKKNKKEKNNEEWITCWWMKKGWKERQNGKWKENKDEKEENKK